MDGSVLATGRGRLGSGPLLAERVREALPALCCERGFAGLTSAELCRRTGVSEADFSRSYPDLEACFIELWEDCKDELLSPISAAFRSAETWHEGMRDAAWAGCRWLQENPARGRVLFVEVSFAGEVATAGRDQLFALCADRIYLGARGRPGTPIAREHADAILGAIWQRVFSAVRAGAFDSLPQLVPQLMFTVVLPYFGAAAAREELRRGPADIARFEGGEI